MRALWWLMSWSTHPAADTVALERAQNKSGYKHVYIEGKKFKAMLKEARAHLQQGLDRRHRHED